MKLEGKTFFITGGASGLGEAAGRLFASKGANVVLADLQEKNGQKVAQEIGNKALYVHCDITSEDSTQKAIKSAVEKFGTLHGCVNCAGVGYPRRVVSKQGSVHPLAPFEQVIKINLIGTFNALRLTAKVMSENKPDEETQERGIIINVASVAAFDGQVGQAAYSASKAGVCGMTLPIARDLATFGIRIITIAPGIFETPMTKLMTPQMRKSLLAQKQFPKRFGDSKEFAGLCQHIIENPYLNGEVIRLDAAVRMQPE